MFFMGYNPGLWDFTALDAFSVPGNTSASFVPNPGNHAGAYDSADGIEVQQQYSTESYPSPSFLRQEEEPTTQSQYEYSSLLVFDLTY